MRGFTRASQRVCCVSCGIWGMEGVVPESLLCEHPKATVCGKAGSVGHVGAAVHPQPCGKGVCVSCDPMRALCKRAGVAKEPPKNRLGMLAWGGKPSLSVSVTNSQQESVLEGSGTFTSMSVSNEPPNHPIKGQALGSWPHPKGTKATLCPFQSLKTFSTLCLS